MKSFPNNYKVGLVIFAAIFIVISIIIHLCENYFWYRLVRAIFVFSLLVYLLKAQGKQLKAWIVLFLLLNGTSCFATVWFENKIMASAAMIFAFISYLMFFWYIIPEIRLKYFTKTFSLLFVIILIVNGYLLLQLIGAMRDFTLSNTQYVFMLLSGISASLLGFFALLLNHAHNTTKSMVFMLMIILLVFSGVFRGIAYYDLVYGNAPVYLARILYALALCILVHFSFLDLKTWENSETTPE